MKQIYILLFLVCTTLLKAQDVRLFENTWYLTKIVSNGTDFLPPTNSDVPFISLNFNQQENFFNTDYCNTIYGGVIFGSNLTDFSLNAYGITLRLCNSQSVGSYENFYLNFFMRNNPNINFTYTIQENETERTLTINSVSNEKAIYSSKNLSAIDFKELNFNVYFEAESSFLVVEITNQNAKTATFELFDILGKRLKINILDSNQTKISVADLAKGVYFVKIKVDDKETVRKVIKP